MRKNALAETDMSDIEKEFDIEMDKTDERFFEDDPDQLFETLMEDDEPEGRYEAGNYANRLYELSLKGFESEYEVDGQLSKILGEMEREFFFKSLKKKFKKTFKSATKMLKNPLVRSLITTGLNVVAPGSGTVANTAAKAMGFELNGEPEENREAWNNFVYFAQEAYDHLAENLDKNAAQTLEDNRQINKAIKYGLSQVMSLATPLGTDDGNTKVVYLKEGERLLIKRI